MNSRMFNYTSTDKQIGELHSKKAGIQPAKWRNLPFCCWQKYPLGASDSRWMVIEVLTQTKKPTWKAQNFRFQYLYIFVTFCPIKQSSSPNPFWDMGFHVNLEVDPTLGCFTAGSRGPTSFAPLVIEASVVSGDRWNQVPTMQEVKIFQAMSKNSQVCSCLGGSIETLTWQETQETWNSCLQNKHRKDIEKQITADICRITPGGHFSLRSVRNWWVLIMSKHRCHFVGPWPSRHVGSCWPWQGPTWKIQWRRWDIG